MSIGCVSKVASITCAATLSAASTSPRAKAVTGWSTFDGRGAKVSAGCTSAEPGKTALNTSVIGSSTSYSIVTFVAA